MNYCDKVDVQGYLLTVIETSFDANLTLYIEAMSRFADTFCGQTLVNNTASTRKYDGNGSNQLIIDDCYDITEVTVSDTVVTPYQYPANRTRKNILELDRDYFTTGRQNVEVTAKFGRFTSLPSDLRFAVTVLVAGVINQVKSQGEAIQSEKVGEYQVVYRNPKERADYQQAMAILKSYRPIII